jgi:AraC-like DNA-binding protein
MPRRARRKATDSKDAAALPVAARWARGEFRLSAETPIHGDYVTSAATEPDWDMHHGVELGVVLSGRVRRFFEGFQTDIGSGQVWLCRTWEPHGWQVLTPSCRHFVWVLLPRVLLDAQFPEAPACDWLWPFMVHPAKRPQASPETRAEILATMQRLAEGLEWSAPRRTATIELAALEVLLLLLNDWVAPRRMHGLYSRLHYDLVDRAAELALTGRRRLTTTEAAEACGLSVVVFSQAFRSVTGIAFASFATRSRLGQAAAQLLRGEDPIAEVSATSGFRCLSSFQRAFERHYRISPAEYRARHRQ